jgi:hypothetical protein
MRHSPRDADTQLSAEQACDLRERRIDWPEGAAPHFSAREACTHTGEELKAGLRRHLIALHC